MEESLRKKSQSDEDVFLLSILASIKELDVIQRMKLRMDFLTGICLTRKRKFSKNLLLPCNSLHPPSLISCHPTLFLQSATLSPNSGISTVPSQMSFILSAHLLLRQYQAQIWKCCKGHSYCTQRKLVYLVLLHSSILGNISSWKFNIV